MPDRNPTCGQCCGYGSGSGQIPNFLDLSIPITKKIILDTSCLIKKNRVVGTLFI